MTILRLHHAQVTIPPGKGPEKQARDFYCRLLGLPEVEKPASLRARGGFWVDLAGQQVHFGVQDVDGRESMKNHLAYQVDDLETWRRRLSENGFIIQKSIPIPGIKRFEFRDPFGNRIEFLEVQAESAE